MPDVCCDPQDGICKADANLDPICAPEVIGCRMTGGGQTVPELTDPDHASHLIPNDVRIATHGGQVGAPFAVGRTGVPADDDPALGCIAGQLQHVRHTGMGKKRVRGIFHTERNEQLFDTLTCDCLGCTDPDGNIIDPVISGGLCNPSHNNADEARICGPEPRWAPANVLCTSGRGFYAERGANGEVNVVFKLVVVDRSEPGGSPPGQGLSEDPPDVYCLRAYQPSETCSMLSLRNALACTDVCLDGVSNMPCEIVLPDGCSTEENLVFDDCGDLYRGNYQIHPPTGATNSGMCEPQPVPE